MARNRISEPFLINPPKRYKRNAMGMMTVMNPGGTPLNVKRAAKRIEYHASRMCASLQIIVETYEDLGFDKVYIRRQLDLILREVSKSV
jgi:hypothetical protein